MERQKRALSLDGTEIVYEEGMEVIEGQRYLFHASYMPCVKIALHNDKTGRAYLPDGFDEVPLWCLVTDQTPEEEYRKYVPRDNTQEDGNVS